MKNLSAIFLSFFVFLCRTNGEVHECQRVCEDGELPKKCLYNFHIEYYYTMSKACYNCPLNVTDCDRHHCIAADGVERGVIVVNRQLPGPSVQVCEGDEIIVNVKNHLPGESASIHWHGIHMIGTPYMDGVPLVTQCPITPASTFQYRFWATSPGTHFWHSHSGFQRADGVFGPLIVRQQASRDPHASLYDSDDPDHVIFISDWLNELTVAKFVAHHHDDGDNKPTSMIVNGKGRLPKPRDQLLAHEMTPYAWLNVEQGLRYRFRVISNGFLNCPIQVSIDQHKLLVIASDGAPIHPVEVDSVFVSAGERYDFVVMATQNESNYWIRFHGGMDCNVNKVYQAAVLHYNGASESEEPEEELNYENTYREGTVLNPINIAPGNESEITVAELRSLDESDSSWNKEPDHKFYLAYDFNAVNNWHFHDPEHYPIFGVSKNNRLFTPQINHISLRMPPSPPLSQHKMIPSHVFCNESTVSNCTKEFCDCVYTLNVPLNALVELVLIDEGFTFDATHPFHVHGTAFRVVAMKRLGVNTTVDQVKELDRQGLIHRTTEGAPIKDTVSVPDGGYTIIRFIANNPGYWLFHCHLSFHIEVGMGLIFKVGEHSDFPPVPSGFPQCGNYFPEEETLSSSHFHDHSTVSTVRHRHGQHSIDYKDYNRLDNNVPMLNLGASSPDSAASSFVQPSRSSVNRSIWSHLIFLMLLYFITNRKS